MDEEDWMLRSLRGSRANPPSQAAKDDGRRAIYSAAIEQFEQLLHAAKVVGAAARPLPLFYALSQAGRAIVAARGEAAEFDGHGLAEDRGQPLPIDLLHRRLKRSRPSKRIDAFTAVSNAIGSPDLKGGVDLGSVWAALPETYRVPEGSWLPDWRSSLSIMEQPTRWNQDDGRVHVQAWSLMGNPHLDEVSTLRGRYPTLPDDAAVGLKPGSPELGPGNWIVVLSWGEGRSLDDVAPLTNSTSDKSRYLIPTLPRQSEFLKPLMMWWLLLFGFSVLARYHPAPWLKALDLDNSELAVPIEAVLERALKVVPALVHRELLG